MHYRTADLVCPAWHGWRGEVCTYRCGVDQECETCSSRRYSKSGEMIFPLRGETNPHSPGPWRRREEPYSSDIEACDKASGGLWLLRARVYGSCAGEIDANARLISKAPDLYDFVRRVANGERPTRQEAKALIAAIDGTGATNAT